MRLVIAIFAAGLALLLPACATTQPVSTVRADACHIPCQPLPELSGEGEGEVIHWMHEVVFRAGQCSRLHDACRGVE